MENKKSFGIWRLVIIILCVLSFVALILPYEVSKGTIREELKNSPETIYDQSSGLTNKDVIDISTVDNIKIHMSGYKEFDGDTKSECLLVLIVTGVMVVSSLIILLGALAKKYVLALVFSLFMLGTSLLLNMDASSRGIIENGTYGYGIAYYLFPALAVIIFITSIIAIVDKKKRKKQVTAE